MHSCQNPTDQPDQSPLTRSMPLQKEHGLRLLNSNYPSRHKDSVCLFHFTSNKKMIVPEARSMIVQLASHILHEYKKTENLSLKDLEIWVSFLDGNGKHPSKEHIGFLTLSQGNLCYRHYDKNRSAYEEFSDYQNETLEDAIQLAKEEFSNSPKEHLMISELEVIAKQEHLQPITYTPVYESG